MRYAAAPSPAAASRRFQRAATIAGALAIVLVAAWLVSVWHLPL
jgi:hypothetical protein